MSGKKVLELGDIVWAKMKGYPSWPAMIVNPPRKISPIPSKKYVLFFGDCDSAWITEKQLMPFEEHFERLSKIKKIKFQIALKAVEKFRTFFIKLEEAPHQKANLEVRKMMLKKYSKVSKKETEQISLLKKKIKKETDAIEKEEKLITYSHFGLTNGSVANNVVKEEKNAVSYDTNMVENYYDCSEEHPESHNKDLLKTSSKVSQKARDSKEIFLPAGEGPSTSRETFGIDYQDDEDFHDTFENNVPSAGISSGGAHQNVKETHFHEFLPAGDGPSTSRETFGKEYHTAQRYFLERLDLCNTASNKKNVRGNVQNRMTLPSTEKPKVIEKPTLLVFHKDPNKKKVKVVTRMSGDVQNRRRIITTCKINPKPYERANRANLSKNKNAAEARNADAKEKNKNAAEARNADAKLKEEKHFVPIDAADVPPEIKTAPRFPMYPLLQVLRSYYWKTYWGIDFGKH